MALHVLCQLGMFRRVHVLCSQNMLGLADIYYLAHAINKMTLVARRDEAHRTQLLLDSTQVV